MLKFSKLNTLKPFDWFLIVGIIAVNLLYSLLIREFDLIGSIAGITGVICVVLVANGNILNYLFGVVNVSLYALISYKAALYGDAVLNLFYYFPMQFIGWYSWIGRRREEESVQIVAKRMNLRGRVLLFIISLFSVAVGAIILHYLNDPQPIKDSATTLLSIIAMFLMVRRFMEQWLLWVAVNIISVVMWIVAFYRGDPHSMLMILMWIFYLANSINGWITWIRLSQSDYR